MGWAVVVEVPFADERGFNIVEEGGDDVAADEAGPGAAGDNGGAV